MILLKVESPNMAKNKFPFKPQLISYLTSGCFGEGELLQINPIMDCHKRMITEHPLSSSLTTS
ncbi:hypothetical protein D3C73_1003550 [compost metagenome]